MSKATRTASPAPPQTAAAVSSLRTYDLHPSAASVGPDGVADFLLPVDDDDADRFCDFFAARLAAMLRARNIDRERMAEALWLVLISIVFEGASLFYLTRLSRRCRELGHLATWGGPESALEQIALGNRPTTDILPRLLAGPRVSPLGSAWVRWLATSGRRDGFSRKPPPLIDVRRDALCLVGGPAALAMAEADGKRPVLTRFEHWIDLTQGWQRRLPDLPRSDAVEEVVRIAEDAFAEGGEAMALHVRASFAETVETLARLALKSLGDVEARARRLPRTFLSGSTSSVHNRAIGRVVQKEGGTVTTFDHGVGGGWRHIPTLSITIWDLPNRYATFTETHAEGIRGLMEPRYKVSGVTCEPVVSPAPLLPPRAARRATRRERRTRIMYVPTLYVGERYYAPRMPRDIAVLDFQARLLSHLGRRGHDVVVKPHPECAVGIRPDLAALAGATIEQRLFDEVAEEADLLLFDCPSSTTFRTAMCTDIPIVVVEHGCVPITEHAFSLIERRAAVVLTRRDESNRIALDWGALDRAIEAAPDLKDPAFANLYFGAGL